MEGKAPRKKRKLSKLAISMIRFQRHLTRNYPLSSAQAFAIGNYVYNRILDNPDIFSESFRLTK